MRVVVQSVYVVLMPQVLSAPTQKEAAETEAARAALELQAKALVVERDVNFAAQVEAAVQARLQKVMED